MEHCEQKKLLAQFLLWYLRDHPRRNKRELAKAASAAGIDVTPRDVNSVLYGHRAWFRAGEGPGKAPVWTVETSAPRGGIPDGQPVAAMRNSEPGGVLRLSASGKWK